MPVKISISDVMKRIKEIENVRAEFGEPTTIGIKKTYNGTKYISVRNMGEVYWLREDTVSRQQKKQKLKRRKRNVQKPE